MLTNLNFLNVGEFFPPEQERERLQNYSEYKKLFDGKHKDVYKHNFSRIQRVDGNFTDTISFEIVINYHKLISKKTADLLCGESPKISVQNQDKQKTLSKILKENDLFNLMYTTTLDTSRYGVGLFYLYKNGTKNRIDITQPAIWFPVVNYRNVREIQYHVICIPNIINNKETELYAEIHKNGQYTIKKFLIKEGKIVKEFKDEEKVINTGMTDFAIIPVQNLITSDNILGVSDYEDIDTIIAELEVRFSQISKILDKHAEPSMQGPESAIDYDYDTGKWSLKTGRYFKCATPDEKVSYLTWDAQLEANFKFIKELQNLLYILSEMGGTLLGDKENINGNISGIAYKLKMENPIQKVKRIRNSMDTALRKAISNCSILEGNFIDEYDLIIEWKDGLTDDDKEQAEVIGLKNGNKPTISHKTSIMQANDMTEEEAEKEYNKIIEEEMQANPLLIPDAHLNIEDDTDDEEIE